MKKTIQLEDVLYELIENKNNCFDENLIKEKYTDYFNEYDYILGDFSYNKLRLKGFCEKNNSKLNKINDIQYKDEYLKELCAYECNYFLLKKVKK